MEDSPKTNMQLNSDTMHRKCRREVIMEYFGEKKRQFFPPCCDVCGSSQEKSDHSFEIQSAVQSVNEVSSFVEKKV
jgi:superfamily II DNA helicase RecQ